MTMTYRGVIKRIVADKGFGFIQADGQADLFFHHTAVAGPPMFDDLTEGQPVTFERDDDSTRGARACEVRADVQQHGDAMRRQSQ